MTMRFNPLTFHENGKFTIFMKDLPSKSSLTIYTYDLLESTVEINMFCFHIVVDLVNALNHYNPLKNLAHA